MWEWSTPYFPGFVDEQFALSHFIEDYIESKEIGYSVVQFSEEDIMDIIETAGALSFCTFKY